MATEDFRPACECCNDTGYYGDNSPGIKGNREYQRCDQCKVEPPILDEIDTLRRQLAAANERARRLEAQMVELREGWPSFEYVDDTEGMVAVEVPEVVIQNFHRILGGA